MANLAINPELAQINQENLIEIHNFHEFSGYSASGSVADASFYTYLLSGAAQFVRSSEKTWEAGFASGSHVSVQVIGENAIICTEQWNQGRVRKEYYILGNGGEEWVKFCSLPEKKNLRLLLSEGVNISGASAEELAKKPIDWSFLENASKINEDRGYCSGTEFNISVCNKYITVEGVFTRNSCVLMYGWSYKEPVAQFFLDGTSNSAAYFAFCKRKAYKEKLSALLAKGAELDEAKRFLKARARWKKEHDAMWCLMLAKKQPNKRVWRMLADPKVRFVQTAKIHNLQEIADLCWTLPRREDFCLMMEQIVAEDYPLAVFSQHKIEDIARISNT